MAERGARGRPRSFDREAKLQIIQKEFWRKGFAATSLDDLSAATGLSRPSLYAAYGDKAAMYLAALRAFGALMERQVVPKLAEGTDLEAALSGFYGAALEIYFNEEGAPLGCLAFSTAIADAPREPRIGEAVLGFLAGLDAGLEACLARCAPWLEEDRRRSLAELAGGMLVNLAARARAGAGREALAAMSKASAALIASAAR